MTPFRTYKINQLIAFLTLSVFCVTGLQYPPAFASVPPVVPAVNSYQPLEVSSLNLPKALGSVEHFWKGKTSETVLILQDAHSNPEAQKKLQKLIRHFQKKFGIRKVGVEGSAGVFDTRIFRSYPEPKQLKQVLKTPLEKGELTAGVSAALFPGKDFPETEFYGIEDWPLYEKGLALYLHAAERQAEILKITGRWQEDIQTRKQNIFSPELLEIDRLLEEFAAHPKNLMELLEKLAAIRKPEPGTEPALLLAEHYQGTAAPKVLEAEVRSLIEKYRPLLEKRLQNPRRKQKCLDLQEKVQKFLTSQISPQSMALALQREWETLPETARAAFTMSDALKGKVEDQKRIEAIDGPRFFSAFREYSDSVKNSLLETDEARELDRKSRFRFLVGKLARLELSREEWKEFQVLSGQEKEISGENFFKKASAPLHFARAFYENAEQRDGAFLKNVRARAAGEASLLIAGGFHAHGMAEHLKEQEISYAVILPALTDLPEAELYQNHMRGNVSWRDYFEVENGKISVYKAFVRYLRDQLLSVPGTSSPGILKLWRDQIIRDLAGKNQTGKAGDYTKFLDETIQKDGTGYSETMKRMNRFLDGIFRLEKEDQISKQNIYDLLKLSKIAAAGSSAAESPDSPVQASLLGFGALPDERELLASSAERFVMRAENRQDQPETAGADHLLSENGKLLLDHTQRLISSRDKIKNFLLELARQNGWLPGIPLPVEARSEMQALFVSDFGELASPSGPWTTPLKGVPAFQPSEDYDFSKVMKQLLVEVPEVSGLESVAIPIYRSVPHGLKALQEKPISEETLQHAVELFLDGYIFSQLTRFEMYIRKYPEASQKVRDSLLEKVKTLKQAFKLRPAGWRAYEFSRAALLDSSLDKDEPALMSRQLAFVGLENEIPAQLDLKKINLARKFSIRVARHVRSVLLRRTDGTASGPETLTFQSANENDSARYNGVDFSLLTAYAVLLMQAYGLTRGMDEASVLRKELAEALYSIFSSAPEIFLKPEELFSIHNRKGPAFPADRNFFPADLPAFIEQGYIRLLNANGAELLKDFQENEAVQESRLHGGHFGSTAVLGSEIEAAAVIYAVQHPDENDNLFEKYHRTLSGLDREARDKHWKWVREFDAVVTQLVGSAKGKGNTIPRADFAYQETIRVMTDAAARPEARKLDAAASVIPAAIIQSVALSPLSEGQVEREFKALVDSGVEFKVPGSFRGDPKSLLSSGYTPKFKVQLFDTTYYMTRLRHDGDEKVMAAYVVQKNPKTGKPVIYARLFYKDYSMIWRSPSHFQGSEAGVDWFGKGDFEPYSRSADGIKYSMEETTNLPLEIQTALDQIGTTPGIPKIDTKLASRIVRGSLRNRPAPYTDFTAQRKAAKENPKNLINKNKRIAYFTQRNDPTTLKFVKGYEPDFQSGIIEVSVDRGTRTDYYGGPLTKYRILSVNRKVQYQFVAGRKHFWLNPPQGLTTQLTTYGSRSVDVMADYDLFLPGFEYHYEDDDGSTYSQIPPGFAGKSNPLFDPVADASKWHAQLPVIQQFRREVIARKVTKPNYSSRSEMREEDYGLSLRQRLRQQRPLIHSFARPQHVTEGAAHMKLTAGPESLYILPASSKGKERESGIPEEAIARDRVIYQEKSSELEYFMHTELALLMMLHRAADIRGHDFVDLGHGKSAILTVAALKLGADKVYAVDGDPELIPAFNQALKLNGVPETQVRRITARFSEAETKILPELSEIAENPVIAANVGVNSLPVLLKSFVPLVRKTGKNPLYLFAGGKIASHSSDDEDPDDDFYHYYDVMISRFADGFEDTEGTMLRISEDGIVQSFGLSTRVVPIRAEARYRGELPKESRVPQSPESSLSTLRILPIKAKGRADWFTESLPEVLVRAIELHPETLRADGSNIVHLHVELPPNSGLNSLQDFDFPEGYRLKKGDSLTYLPAGSSFVLTYLPKEEPEKEVPAGPVKKAPEKSAVKKTAASKPAAKTVSKEVYLRRQMLHRILQQVESGAPKLTFYDLLMRAREQSGTHYASATIRRDLEEDKGDPHISRGPLKDHPNLNLRSETRDGSVLFEDSDVYTSGANPFIEETDHWIRVGINRENSFYIMAYADAGKEAASGISEEALGRILYLPEKKLAYGHHTALTLYLMLENQNRIKGRTVFDLGHGNDGIVTLAAYKLGAKRVFAVEIDSEAQKAFPLSMKRNGVPESFYEQKQGFFERILPIVLQQLGDERSPVLISDLPAKYTIALFSQWYAPVYRSEFLTPFFIAAGAGFKHQTTLEPGEESRALLSLALGVAFENEAGRALTDVKGYNVRRDEDEDDLATSIAFTARQIPLAERVADRREARKIKKEETPAGAAQLSDFYESLPGTTPSSGIVSSLTVDAERRGRLAGKLPPYYEGRWEKTEQKLGEIQAALKVDAPSLLTYFESFPYLLTYSTDNFKAKWKILERIKAQRNFTNLDLILRLNTELLGVVITAAEGQRQTLVPGDLRRLSEKIEREWWRAQTKKPRLTAKKKIEEVRARHDSSETRYEQNVQADLQKVFTPFTTSLFRSEDRIEEETELNILKEAQPAALSGVWGFTVRLRSLLNRLGQLMRIKLSPSRRGFIRGSATLGMRLRGSSLEATLAPEEMNVVRGLLNLLNDWPVHKFHHNASAGNTAAHLRTLRTSYQSLVNAGKIPSAVQTNMQTAEQEFTAQMNAVLERIRAGKYVSEDEQRDVYDVEMADAAPEDFQRWSYLMSLARDLSVVFHVPSPEEYKRIHDAVSRQDLSEEGILNFILQRYINPHALEGLKQTNERGGKFLGVEVSKESFLAEIRSRVLKALEVRSDPVKFREILPGDGSWGIAGEMLNQRANEEWTALNEAILRDAAARYGSDAVMSDRSGDRRWFHPSWADRVLQPVADRAAIEREIVMNASAREKLLRQMKESWPKSAAEKFSKKRERNRLMDLKAEEIDRLDAAAYTRQRAMDSAGEMKQRRERKIQREQKDEDREIRQEKGPQAEMILKEISSDIAGLARFSDVDLVVHLNTDGSFYNVFWQGEGGPQDELTLEALNTLQYLWPVSLRERFRGQFYRLRIEYGSRANWIEDFLKGDDWWYQPESGKREVRVKLKRPARLNEIKTQRAEARSTQFKWNNIAVFAELNAAQSVIYGGAADTAAQLSAVRTALSNFFSQQKDKYKIGEYARDRRTLSIQGVNIRFYPQDQFTGFTINEGDITGSIDVPYARRDEARRDERLEDFIIATALLMHGGPVNIVDTAGQSLRRLMEDSFLNQLNISEEEKTAFLADAKMLREKIGWDYFNGITGYASGWAYSYGRQMEEARGSKGKFFAKNPMELPTAEFLEEQRQIYIQWLKDVKILFERLTAFKQKVPLMTEEADTVWTSFEDFANRNIGINLDAARFYLESNESPLDFQPLELNQWLKTQVWMTKAKSVSSRLQVNEENYLRFDPASDPVSVRVNGPLLHLALERFISNAFHELTREEVLPEDQKVVRIKTVRGEDGTAQIIFLNPGTLPEESLEMDPEQGVQKIFAYKFIRRSYAGGIGGTFAARAIQRMNGHIQAENVTEEGIPQVRITVSFPAAEESVSSSAVSVPAKMRPSPSSKVPAVLRSESREEASMQPAEMEKVRAFVTDGFADIFKKVGTPDSETIRTMDRLEFARLLGHQEIPLESLWQDPALGSATGFLFGAPFFTIGPALWTEILEERNQPDKNRNVITRLLAALPEVQKVGAYFISMLIWNFESLLSIFSGSTVQINAATFVHEDLETKAMNSGFTDEAYKHLVQDAHFAVLFGELIFAAVLGQKALESDRALLKHKIEVTAEDERRRPFPERTRILAELQWLYDYSLTDAFKEEALHLWREAALRSENRDGEALGIDPRKRRLDFSADDSAQWDEPVSAGKGLEGILRVTLPQNDQGSAAVLRRDLSPRPWRLRLMIRSSAFILRTALLNGLTLGTVLIHAAAGGKFPFWSYLVFAFPSGFLLFVLADSARVYLESLGKDAGQKTSAKTDAELKERALQLFSDLKDIAIRHNDTVLLRALSRPQYFDLLDQEDYDLVWDGGKSYNPNVIYFPKTWFSLPSLAPARYIAVRRLIGMDYDLQVKEDASRNPRIKKLTESSKFESIKLAFWRVYGEEELLQLSRAWRYGYFFLWPYLSFIQAIGSISSAAVVLLISAVSDFSQTRRTLSYLYSRFVLKKELEISPETPGSMGDVPLESGDISSRFESRESVPYAVTLIRKESGNWEAVRDADGLRTSFIMSSPVRSLTQEQWQEYKRLAADIFEEEPLNESQKLDNPDHYYGLLFHEGRVVGYYDYLIKENLIDTMKVHPDFRGTGAVDILLEDFRESLNRIGVSNFHAQVIRHSPRARTGHAMVTVDELKQRLGILSEVTLRDARNEARLLGSRRREVIEDPLERWLRKEIPRLFVPPAGERPISWLDLGSGSGIFIPQWNARLESLGFPKEKITGYGVEASDLYFLAAQRYTGLPILYGDAGDYASLRLQHPEELPKDLFFDLVIINAPDIHAIDFEAFLKTADHFLKPDGRVLIRLFTYEDAAPGQKRRTKDQVGKRREQDLERISVIKMLEKNRYFDTEYGISSETARLALPMGNHEVGALISLKKKAAVITPSMSASAKINVRKEQPKPKRASRSETREFNWRKQNQDFKDWREASENQDDAVLLQELLTVDSEEALSHLIDLHPKKIGVASHEKENPLEGRTVYFKLKEPIGEIKVLRIKAARPRTAEDGVTVLPYSGQRGFSSGIMEVRENGRIGFYDSGIGPFGGMSLNDAVREYDFMVFSQAKTRGYLTDTPLALGEFKNLRYPVDGINQPLAFVISGMTHADLRLVFYRKADQKDASLGVVDMKSGAAQSFKDEDAAKAFDGLGRMLRKMHDAGYVHRFPHLNNIGVEIKGDGKVKFVFRDLNNVRRFREEPPEMRAAWRFTDFLRMRQYIGKYHAKGFFIPDAIIEFFTRGYFNPGDKQLTPEWGELVTQMVRPDIYNFILDQRDANGEFHPSEIPQYQEIWNHLLQITRAENRNEEASSISGRPFQSSILNRDALEFRYADTHALAYDMLPVNEHTGEVLAPEVQKMEAVYDQLKEKRGDDVMRGRRILMALTYAAPDLAHVALSPGLFEMSGHAMESNHSRLARQTNFEGAPYGFTAAGFDRSTREALVRPDLKLLDSNDLKADESMRVEIILTARLIQNIAKALGDTEDFRMQIGFNNEENLAGRIFSPPEIKNLDKKTDGQGWDNFSLQHVAALDYKAEHFMDRERWLNATRPVFMQIAVILYDWLKEKKLEENVFETRALALELEIGMGHFEGALDMAKRLARAISQKGSVSGLKADDIAAITPILDSLVSHLTVLQSSARAETRDWKKELYRAAVNISWIFVASTGAWAFVKFLQRIQAPQWAVMVWIVAFPVLLVFVLYDYWRDHRGLPKMSDQGIDFSQMQPYADPDVLLFLDINRTVIAQLQEVLTSGEDDDFEAFDQSREEIELGALIRGLQQLKQLANPLVRDEREVMQIIADLPFDTLSNDVRTRISGATDQIWQNFSDIEDLFGKIKSRVNRRGTRNEQRSEKKEAVAAAKLQGLAPRLARHFSEAKGTDAELKTMAEDSDEVIVRIGARTFASAVKTAVAAEFTSSRKKMIPPSVKTKLRVNESLARQVSAQILRNFVRTQPSSESLVVAFHRPGREKILEEVLGQEEVKRFLSLAFISKAMNEIHVEGLNIQRVRVDSLGLRPNRAAQNSLIAVLTEEEIPERPYSYAVRQSGPAVEGEPFLDTLMEMIDILAGAVVSSSEGVNGKKDLKDPGTQKRIKAELLSRLFGEGFLKDRVPDGIFSFDAEGNVKTDRGLFMRLVTEAFAARKMEISA